MLVSVLRGVVGITTVWGAKKTVDGLVTRGQAREREIDAESCIADARERLGAARLKTERHLGLLADTRAGAARLLAEHAIPQLRRVSDVDDEGRVHGSLASTAHPAPDATLRPVRNAIVPVGTGAVIGRVAGAGLSSAAVSVTAAYGVASTGTAISSLSGAAANKAILASLGGGAIKAGGAGMAGGQALLGGVAIGPMIMMAGLRFASSCDERLVAAERYHADATIAAAEADAGVERLGAIDRRADELREVTGALATRVGAVAATVAVKLDELSAGLKLHYASLPVRTRNAVHTLIRLTCELDAIIAVNLHDEVGNLLQGGDDAIVAGRAACSWRV